MKIHVQYGSTKHKQKAGDVCTHKRHGRQVRIHARSDGCMLYNHGKPVYEWVELTMENLEANMLGRLKHLLVEGVPNEL